MAAIPEYFAPGADTVIHPSEVGEQALVRAGRYGEETARQIGGEYASIGHNIGQATATVGKLVDDHMTATDTITQTNNLAQQHLQVAKDMSAAAASGDPAAYQKVLDKYNEGQSQFMDGFRTERGRDRGVALWNESSKDVERQAIAGASATAGAAVLKQMHQLGDTLSQTVSADLSTLPNAQSQLDAAWDAAKSSGNLTPERMATLDEDHMRQKGVLSQSALRSAAAKPGANFAALQKFADQGGFAGMEKGAVDATIQEGKRMQTSDAERGLILNKMAQEQKSQAVLGSWLKQNLVLGPDGMISVGPDAGKSLMAGVAGMQPAQIEQAISAVRSSAAVAERARDRAAAGKDLVTDQSVRGGFLSNMSQPVTSPDFPTQLKIYQAHADGKLDTEDTTLLLHMSEAAEHDPQVAAGFRQVSEDNPVLKAGFDQAAQRLLGAAGPAGAIGVGGIGVNQAVKAKEDQFRMDTLRILQGAVMNHQDLTPYLDPTSKQYVFSQERVDQYRPTKQELQNKLVAPILAAPASGTPAAKPPLEDILRKALSFPAKPGEPPAEPPGPHA
jgi:hypothetical protein